MFEAVSRGLTGEMYERAGDECADTGETGKKVAEFSGSGMSSCFENSDP